MAGGRPVRRRGLVRGALTVPNELASATHWQEPGTGQRYTDDLLDVVPT